MLRPLVPEAAKEKLPARKYRTAGEFVTLSLHHRGCMNLIYITSCETGVQTAFQI